MRSFHVVRLASTLAIASLAAAAVGACGASKDTSNFNAGQLDSSADDALEGDAEGGVGTIFGNGDAAIGCTPKTCSQLGYNCGANGDGCGGTLDCGQCPAGQVCGAGGYSICGAGTVMQGDAGADGGATNNCTPETCSSLNIGCGYAGDGCGGVLQCGTCTNPTYCGGGGYNKCGGDNGLSPDGGSLNVCQPTTCQALKY